MLRFLSGLFLKLTGWTPVGEAPKVDRYVFIAAPHTSNWDLIWMIAFALYWRVPLRWVGKDSLFRPPLGWFFRLLRGVPVDRSGGTNQVEAIAAVFDRYDRLALAIAAEGTRSRREFWKSGFYHIARAAGVPIVPSVLDFGKKRAEFGQPLYPTGDVAADMDRLRAFYAGAEGKNPELFTPPRLRDESPVD